MNPYMPIDRQDADKVPFELEPEEDDEPDPTSNQTKTIKTNNMNNTNFVKKQVTETPVVKKKSYKLKISFAVILIILGSLLYGTYKVSKWFDTHKLEFQSPIQTPVLVKQRTSLRHDPIFKEAQAAEPIIPRYKDPVDQYIYEKFGKDGDTAVRVSRAENGTHQCDRIVIEPNNTVSIGVFMINSVHFKRFPAKDMIDCYKNADAGFQIYTEQHGFQAWSVYKNGSYLKVNLSNYLN